MDELVKEGVPYKDIIALMAPQIPGISEKNLSLFARQQYARHAAMEERIAIEQARARSRASNKIEALSEYQELAAQACSLARRSLDALNARKDLTDPAAVKLLTAVLFALPGIGASARHTADFIANASKHSQQSGSRPWETAAMLEAPAGAPKETDPPDSTTESAS